MMKYIVDNMLVFEPHERVLYLKHNPLAAVDVGIISARLFEVLLTHPDGVTREYLLDSVWMAYGLKPTNSNLNNHMSILRRNVTSLTKMDDLITTLPKKGFVLNKKYAVYQLNDDDLKNRSQTSEPPNTVLHTGSVADDLASFVCQQHNVPSKISVKARVNALLLRVYPCSHRLGVYTIAGVLCIIAALLFYSWDVFMDRKSVFFQYNHCNFKPLRTVAPKDKQYAISLVMNHIYKDKVNCIADNYDIYFYFSGRDKQRSEFRFYSICRLNEKNRYSHCDTSRFT